MKLGRHDVLNKKTKVKALLGGHRYFVSFIDNLSRYYWIYPMRQRFEVLGMLVKWNMMEKQTDRKIKELQIDNIEKYKN